MIRLPTKEMLTEYKFLSCSLRLLCSEEWVLCRVGTNVVWKRNVPTIAG